MVRPQRKEFLDNHLQPVRKEGKLYIKDKADFLDKLKDLGEVPEGTILVAADVTVLYPNIPHAEGLEVFPYACIFMGYNERQFLKTKSVKPWVWKRFVDHVFFIWMGSEHAFFIWIGSEEKVYR